MNTEPKINLLLVDDRAENLLALEAALQPLGAHLLQARSGEGALQLARAHDFAAVLLDVQMPGMDGFETATRLRELGRARQVPILFITASEVDERHIARGYALGAVDYILKPYTPEALRSKAAAYIALFERTRRLQGQLEAAVGLQDVLNILVVNDDLAGLLATETSLAKLGMSVHVVSAHSGREALSLLLKQTFALILLDVHMPDMDGFEVAALLRDNERCRHIPLVFVTATMKAEADVTEGYTCGALDFIFTPITAELLCAKVAAILNQFGQQRLLARQVDEISDLNRALHASAAELENANATLEQRVRERTAELVKANEALQQSEDRYRSLVETAFDWVWEVDAQGRYTYASPRVWDLLGYRPEEVLGRTPFDLMPEDEALRVKTVFDQLVTGRKPFVMLENINRHRDGRLVVLETSGMPVLAPDGTLLGYRGMDRDVTGRKQADTALRLFRMLIDRSRDGIKVLDLKTERFVDASESACRDLGYTREELLALTIADVVVGLDRATYEATIAQLKESGHVTFEGEHRRKDGSIYPIEVVLSLIKLDRNYVVGVDRDITKRKRAEQQLRDSEALYQSLVENLPQQVFRKDLAGRFTFGNGPFCQSLGQPLAEILGQTDLDLCPPALAEKYRRDDQRVVETGQPFQCEEEYRQADGKTIFVHVIKTPLRDVSGQIVGVQGISWDITERKRAQEEIRQLNAGLEQRVRDRTAELEAANKEMESFSYSVSHDLRAPLRAIDGYARILTDDYTARLDAEGQRLLGVVSGEARRMGELIEALLNLSRLGRQEMTTREVDMTALANAVVRESAATQPQRNVRWEVQPLPPAHADPILVRQVWVNLITNALKFTRARDPAVIQIGSQRENGEVIYHVADNGAGFDMRYVAKLFGVFQRLHQAQDFPGTGIGLALVQRIIHRHGGRVWAEGKVGEGATFYFTVSPRT